MINALGMEGPATILVTDEGDHENAEFEHTLDEYDLHPLVPAISRTESVLGQLCAAILIGTLQPMQGLHPRET